MGDLEKAKYMIMGSNISQYRLSKETGISQGNISRVKNGKRMIGNIAYMTIKKLSNYYDSIYQKGEINMLKANEFKKYDEIMEKRNQAGARLQVIFQDIQRENGEDIIYDSVGTKDTYKMNYNQIYGLIKHNKALWNDKDAIKSDLSHFRHINQHLEILKESVQSINENSGRIVQQNVERINKL